MFVDLIKQLYSDGHVTAEQVCELESRKLFEHPATTAPSITSMSCDDSVINGNSSSIVASAVEVDVPKCHVEVSSTSDEILTSSSITEHNFMDTHYTSSVSMARPEQTIDMTTHKHDVELPSSVTPSAALPADPILSEKNPTGDLYNNEASGISVVFGVNVQKEKDEKSLGNLPISTVQDNTEQSDIQNKNLFQCSSSAESVACLDESSIKSNGETTACDLTVNDHVKSSSPVLLEHKEGTVNGIYCTLLQYIQNLL